MLPAATPVVDTKALLDVVLASLAAGIGVTAVFSTAIFGFARFADMRRDRRPVAAAGFALLSVLALSACAAAVVFGIVVMTTK